MPVVCCMSCPCLCLCPHDPRPSLPFTTFAAHESTLLVFCFRLPGELYSPHSCHTHFLLAAHVATLNAPHALWMTLLRASRYVYACFPLWFWFTLSHHVCRKSVLSATVVVSAASMTFLLPSHLLSPPYARRPELPVDGKESVLFWVVSLPVLVRLPAVRWK